MSEQTAATTPAIISAVEPLVAADCIAMEQPSTISAVKEASGDWSNEQLTRPAQRAAKARVLRSTVVVVPDDDDYDHEPDFKDRGVGAPPPPNMRSLTSTRVVVVPDDDGDYDHEPNVEDRGVITPPPTDTRSLTSTRVVVVPDDDGDYNHEPDFENGGVGTPPTGTLSPADTGVVVVPEDDDDDDDDEPEFKDRGVATSPPGTPSPPADGDYDYETDYEDGSVGTPPPTGTPSPAGSALPTRAPSPVDSEDSGEDIPAGTRLTGMMLRNMTPDKLPQHLREILYACIRPAQPRYYAVIRGKAVGIFVDWLAVAPFVAAIPESIYMPYPTFALAMAAFQDGVATGKVALIPNAP